MKYLQTYEGLFDLFSKNKQKDSDDIDAICKRHDIKNWTINNGLVDVDGYVELSLFSNPISGFIGVGGILTEIPLKFGNVSVDFGCHDNKLTSLEGAPQSVGRDFDCHRNQLTSLEGGPQSVGGDFYCHNNKLTTLEGSPESVVGHFNCGHNQLTSLKGAPKSVGGNFVCQVNPLTSLEGSPKSVSGDFYCDGNQLRSLEGGPQSVGGIFYCQGNPVYEVWKLISPDDKWNESNMELFNDYDCIRGEDIIIDRFNDFLRQIGRPEVDSVKGYNNI